MKTDLLQSSAPGSARHQRLLFEMNPNPAAEFDTAGFFLRINPAWSRVAGYAPDELHGTRLDELVETEFAPLTRRLLREAAKGEVRRHEFRCRHRNGSRFELDMTLAPLTDGGGINGVYGIAREIGAHKRRDNHIRVAASAMVSMADAVIITDPARAIIWVNPAFTAMTGYSLRIVVGRTPALLREAGPSGDSGDGYEQAAAAARADGHWRGELTCRREDGEDFASLVSITAVRDENGEITNYVDVLTDISALKTYQSRIDFLVSHDPLTKLPGRGLFEHDLLVAIEQARADQTSLAMGVIGIDSLRMVNDSLGHEAGDSVLHEAARRLAGNLRDIDTLARLSGDQFAIMLPNAEADDIGLVINKLLGKLSEPITLRDERLFLSASAGISCYPRDGADTATLTVNADAAMYQAKRLGRNTYRFYDPGLNEEVHNKLRLANHLRHAIERDEFLLEYQPTIHLDSGELAGVEALLRWRHPSFGVLLPDTFIGLAEDVGLIRWLGDWVLDTACRQMVAWHRAGCEIPRLAVNLSVSQLHQPNIVDRVETLLDETGLNPACLEFEITETTLMDDPVAHRKVIDRLNELGISFAIDDFGTGYSSLAYLRDLPVDCLKIDRGFVAGIPEDDPQMVITRAIISMARTLGKRIIAEGIETRAQLDFLRDQGCDEGQGFYISRPRPPEAIGGTFASERPGAVLYRT
jgi:diguanylate cyclase (GGDEF)-like protein/PAS domain S-box-containing protein